MRQLSDRTLRGLRDAIGVPSVLGVLTLAFLTLSHVFGAAT